MEDETVTEATVVRAMAKVVRPGIFDYQVRFEELLDQKAADLVFDLVKREKMWLYSKIDFMETLSRLRSALYDCIAQRQVKFVGRPNIEFGTLSEFLYERGYSHTYMEDELKLKCPPVDKGPIDVNYYVVKKDCKQKQIHPARQADNYQAMVRQHGRSLGQVALHEEKFHQLWRYRIQPSIPRGYNLHAGCDIDNVYREPFEILLHEHLFLDLEQDKVNDIVDPKLYIRMDKCVHPDTDVPFYRLKLRPFHGDNFGGSHPECGHFELVFANTWVGICQWAEDV